MKAKTGEFLSKANIYSITTAPDPPGSFKATSITSKEAMLNWIHPFAEISIYLIKLTNGANSNEFRINSTFSKKLLENLEPGSRYTAEMKSVPLFKPLHSPPSIVTTSFVTLLPVPEIVNKSSSKNSISFQIEKMHTNGIESRYSSEADGFSEFSEWDTPEMSNSVFLLKNLRPNLMYFVEVRVDSEMESESNFFEMKTKVGFSDILSAISLITGRDPILFITLICYK